MSNPPIPIIPGLHQDPNSAGDPIESLRPDNDLSSDPATPVRDEDGTPVGRSDVDADIERTRE